MVRRIAIGAGLLAALSAPGLLLVAKATPQPPPDANTSRLVQGKSFAPVCKSGEVVDSRPDPAWVGQSFARDNCTAPQMPAPINGLVASREEIVAGMIYNPVIDEIRARLMEVDVLLAATPQQAQEAHAFVRGFRREYRAARKRRRL